MVRSYNLIKTYNIMRTFINELSSQYKKYSKLTHKATAVAGFTVGYLSAKIPQVDIEINIRKKSNLLK